MSSGGEARLLAGRYRLEHRIGSGGFGEVWRGTDVALERPVAVKQMRPEVAQDDAARARFRAEAQHAGALNHEGIARIYDYDEPAAPEPPFLVMEFVDGPSLAEVLAGGPLEPARVMDVVAQVAAGLEVAHQSGLIHRDIQPGNIMLGRDGLVKLTDFGICAVAWSASLTSPGMLLGTPGYLAPERASGGSATEAGDLYALGVVAYQCLAGRLPFDGTPEEVALAQRRHVLPPLPAAVPADVAALVSELTAREPAARPSRAGEVADRAAALHDRLTTESARPEVAAPDGQLAPRPAAAARQDWLPAGAYQAVDAVTRPLHWTRRKRQAHYAPLTLAAAGAILIGLLLTDVIGPVRSQPVTASHRPSVVMVEVNAATLRGRPVDAVRAQLLRLGLKVALRWRVSNQVSPGMVLSVQPSGRVPRGTLVVVMEALQPAAVSSGTAGSASTPAVHHVKARPGRRQPTAIPTPTHSPSPTSSPTPSPTGSPTPTGTSTPTGTPTPTGTLTLSSGAAPGPAAGNGA